VAAGTDPVHDETVIVDLDVEGALPEALSGRYLRIGPNPIGRAPHGDDPTFTDGMVHVVTLRAGQAPSYRNRWVRTDPTSRKLGVEPVPGPPAPVRDAATTNLLAFGESIVALSDCALAYELAVDGETLRRVDLAGGARPVGAFPWRDAATGELHLLSSPGEATVDHHVISAGGLTRRSRSIDNAPGPITGLAVTAGRLLLFGEGIVGVTIRHGEDRTTWLPTRMTASDRVVTAYDDGDAVVAHVVGHTLRRCTIDLSHALVRVETPDRTPLRFGRVNERLATSRHRFLYTVAAGGAAIHKHDLIAGRRETVEFGGARRPGEFLFVADPARSYCEDGGWLLGLVHSADRTELVVLDAARITAPAVATVVIPRRVPFGLHGLWAPMAADVLPSTVTRVTTKEHR